MEKNKVLKFVTGNKAKVFEISNLLAPIKIEQLNIDLDEIQEIDSKKVIEHKLKQAFKHHAGPFIIDDSSLYLSCFDYKLPGPFIKWFNVAIGTKAIYEMCNKMGDFKARAITCIALAENSKSIKYFAGELKGKITKPKGKWGFGYDPIFMPEGFTKTLSELKADKNFTLSPRGVAITKLKKYLTKA